MNARLLAAADVCPADNGGLCDCGNTVAVAERILPVVCDLAAEAVDEYLNEREVLHYVSGDVIKGAIAARNRIVRALS